MPVGNLRFLPEAPRRPTQTSIPSPVLRSRASLGALRFLLLFRLPPPPSRLSQVPESSQRAALWTKSIKKAEKAETKTWIHPRSHSFVHSFTHLSIHPSFLPARPQLILQTAGTCVYRRSIRAHLESKYRLR